MLTLDIQRDYESSSINKIQYNEDTASLLVEFTSNSIYEYYKVPLEVFQTFENIIEEAKAGKGRGSIGHQFHIAVKPFYKYRKIRG